jgi:hypothetical protein
MTIEDVSTGAILIYEHGTVPLSNSLIQRMNKFGVHTRENSDLEIENVSF